jgi:hypothetical protein
MNYKVKSNLKHNKKHYVKGDEIELDDQTAKQLLSDNIIANIGDNTEEEEKETPQPAVNEVNRKDGDTEGEATVSPGTPDKPEEDGTTTDEAPKAKYKVTKKFERPRGTILEVDTIIELTEEEAGDIKSKFIELVEEDDADNL